MAVPQGREHVLEAEGVVHACADGPQDLVGDGLRGKARRDLEQPFERNLVSRRARRLLRRLQRERSVVGESDEHFELLVGRTAPADRFVDRQDAEQVAVGVAERDEEGVLGLPGVGALPRCERRDIARPVVDLRPVEFAGRHDEGATPSEALVEQALPVADAANLPEQLPSRGIAPMHGRDAEVVPRRAVDVDHDALVAERLGDGSRDRGQQLEQVTACTHECRDLEEAS